METSPGAQWLRLCLPVQGEWGSIPGLGAKFPRAFRPESQNIKQRQYCNKLHKAKHFKKKLYLKDDPCEKHL